MEVMLASAMRVLPACVLALFIFAALGDDARAQSPIKVDHPEILVVVFDYDGLTQAPEVTQISFILYSDGTFALMDRAAEASEGDAFIQGKLSPDEALAFAAQTETDLAKVSSDVQRLEDMGSKGGFEIWHWSPADHTYLYPMRTGHPCDAPAASSLPGLQTFCQRLQSLRGQGGIEHHPVRTSFIFTKAEASGTDVRPIPEALGPQAIGDTEPMVGVCTDTAISNQAMADLMAPSSAGQAVLYQFSDLPPLELIQIIRATYVPKTFDIPLGDVIQSVGDPCDAIRSSDAKQPASP
ncbi:MAG TPA: hypothetical protein VMT54_00170 [Candidatus Cybelea sp.]|nr:hypothetical protein [Candidatus Cybelea sp.]